MIFLLSISEIVFLGSRKVFIKSAKITTNERNVDAFVCCVELKKPNGPLNPKSPFGRIFNIFTIAGLGTKTCTGLCWVVLGYQGSLGDSGHLRGQAGWDDWSGRMVQVI